MQKRDISLKILLCFLKNPFFEIDEIEGMLVIDLFGLEPLDEEGKMIWDFFAVENSVDHVAAEQSHFDFVAGVGIDFAILMDRLEDIASG